MGSLKGLGKIVKDSAPWLQIVNCFNRCIELALKDTFDTSPFGDIDTMLMKLCYLYEKSPKRCRELKELSEAYAHSIPKPSKAHGTRWIERKYFAIKKLRRLWRLYGSPLEFIRH